MSQTIKLKRGTSTPTTSNIVSGEVAIDTSAQKLYINDAGTIKEIGGGLASISVSDVPNLPASKITSGTFSTARIPNLAASKITSGTFAAARIPNLAASKITSGTFDAARIPTLSQYLRSDANDTTTGNITIQKTTPRILLKDNNGSSGSYPEIEFETTNNQGVKLYHNEFDGELPAGGYGLVLAESDTNTQFPTTGTLSFSVLGEMYAGGTTLSSLNKVFHDGYHPNADKLTTARLIAGSSFDGTADISISYNNLTNKPTIPTSLPANGGNADTVDGYHASDIMSATSARQWSGLNASGAQAKRYTIMRLYVCPAHWDAGHQNIKIFLHEESYESSYVEYHLWSDSNGGNQNTAMQLFVKDAGGYDNTRYKVTVGSPVDAGYDYSGQNVYYYDIYVDVAYYKQVRAYAFMRGHGYTTTAPTSGGATTLVYTSPSGSNISDFTDVKTNSYFKHHKIWNEANDGPGSGLDADLLDGQQGSHYLDYNNLTNKPTIPSVGNGTLTVTAGTSLSGGGSFTANQSGNSSVTLNVATPANAPSSWQDVVGWNGGLIKDTAVEIHGSGYLRATYLNMTHGVGTRSSDTIFYSSTDDYIRKTNATGMRAALNVPTRTGGDASGTWGISITGNADTVDGLHAHSGTNNQANRLVRTDGNGYIQAGWINTSSGNNGTTTISRIYASQDGYIRYYTPANFGSQISSHINYNNIQNKPTIPDTSNLVTTNTAQTISGAKTFSANVGVSGNVSANFYAFNGSYVNATADVRAPIFYDRNNTAFYIHADSESVLGNVRANDFRVSSGNGKGVRFWNSNSYKIYMSSTADTSWGGRAPYESTSDYNMYFRMTGGTNRGFVFRNNTTNVAGIDSSGNFNTSGIIKTGNGAASAPAYSFTADYDSGMFSLGSNAVGFSTGGTQRFKINSNGLLLTGTSSLWVNGQQTITNTRDIANVVNYQNTDGHMQLHRTAAAPLIINRKGTTGSSGSSRGEILNFKSASTKIGRIGYAQPYGGNFYFAAGDWGLGLYSFSSARFVQPSDHTGAIRDNQIDLGSTTARFDDVYATNGTIQTSDRNEKQDIQELTDAETRAAVTCKGLMRRFRWVDSVAEKGDDARYHFGAIAQDVEAAFTAEGLNAGDYGLFIRTTWWEHEGDWYPEADVAPEGAVEKTRLGIRYNQLFAFIIGAL